MVTNNLARGSLIGRHVRISSCSLIEDAIIIDRVEIGRGSGIRRATIDKHNVIPAGTETGMDTARDHERYFD